MNEELKGKIKVKEAIRRALEIKTIIFIIAISISLVYYAKCFMKNKVLFFGKDSSVILLGFFIMTLWLCVFTLYLLHENRKLLKVIVKKDETIEVLLNQLIDKTNNIEVQNNKIEEKADNLQEALDYDIERNEEQYTQLIKSNRNTQELIMDESRGDSIAQ